MIRSETATVYWGGGRRWLTLRAACHAEARSVFKRRIASGRVCVEDLGTEYPRIHPAIQRLARRYEARAKTG